jgi:RHS repeat-associated protein
VNTNGAVVAHREYDAFGNTIVATGSMVNDFKFWFSTKYLDQETGFYYYGYRYYDPVTGRWLSIDPMGEMSGLNIYSFVFNNAVVRWDILGLKCCGPDVTDYVARTLADIQKTFDGWAERQKEACINIVNPAVAGGSWEIQPLADLGFIAPGTKDKPLSYSFKSGHQGEGIGCDDTVTYAGKCYHSRDVNYMMWGKIMSLCRKVRLTQSDLSSFLSKDALIAVAKDYVVRHPENSSYQQFLSVLTDPKQGNQVVQQIQSFYSSQVFTENFAMSMVYLWKSGQYGGNSMQGAAYFTHMGYVGSAPSTGNPILKLPDELIPSFIKQKMDLLQKYGFNLIPTFSDPSVDCGKLGGKLDDSEPCNWKWLPIKPANIAGQ